MELITFGDECSNGDECPNGTAAGAFESCSVVRPTGLNRREAIHWPTIERAARSLDWQ